MRWVKVNLLGEKPPKRYFHAMCAFGDRAIIVFGGKDDHKRFHDCFVFHRDPKSTCWTEPKIKGTPPTARSAHTLTVVGSKVYVFGGHRDGEKFNDIHILDTKLMEWVQPTISGPAPRKRNAHTTNVVGKTLYIFGGFDGESCNDVWMFDTELLTWTRAHPVGPAPSKRCCHSTTTIRDNELWVFAGKNNDADGVIERFNDMYVLDTNTLTWRNPNPQIKGSLPSKRNAHTAVPYKHNVVVFGGFDGESCNDVYFFDTTGLIWTQIEISNVPPAPRYCHTTCISNGSGGTKMISFGGCDADKNYNDLQILEFEDEMQIVRAELAATKEEVKKGKEANTVLQQQNRQLSQHVMAQQQYIEKLQTDNTRLDLQLDDSTKQEDKWDNPKSILLDEILESPLAPSSTGGNSSSVGGGDSSAAEESSTKKRDKKKKRKSKAENIVMGQRLNKHSNIIHEDTLSMKHPVPPPGIKPLHLGATNRPTAGPITTPARLPILDNDNTPNTLFPPIKTDRTPASSYQNLL